MSIAVLTQVYDEVRRLAIAGSGLAAGDFRLQKLIAPLEKAGKKAPVFAKVAEAAQAVVDGNEKDSAENLLALSTLVGAVLYTQGATGADGELEPLETVELGPPVTGTSARLLKPLVEALTSTGSGRMEIVTDANKRGAFRDIRLVNLAVKAIDDPYPELADYVAFEILPQYGRTIVPLLRADFNPKGKKADVRRLRLMHQLDPETAGELAHEVLENGSKEVKVEAIVCLNHDRENVPLLLEQAGSRQKDVRAAALQGMAKFGDKEVIEAMTAALNGKDLEIAVGPASRNPSPQLKAYIIDQARVLRDLLLDESTSKTARKGKLRRLLTWLTALRGRDDEPAVAFLRETFDRRDEISAWKDGATHGDNVNRSIALLIVSSGDADLQQELFAAHKSLAPELLPMAFLAGVQTQAPKKIYDEFSPYLAAKTKGKKRSDPVRVRQEQITEVLYDLTRRPSPDDPHAPYRHYVRLVHLHDRRGALEDNELVIGELPAIELDPRWVELAIKKDDGTLVQVLAQPGNRKVNAYLSKTFPKALSSRDAYWKCADLLETMVRIGHPDVEKHFLQALQKMSSKRGYHYGIYWLGRFIPQLSKDIVEPLEKMIPDLPDRVADELVPYITELKSKTS